MTAIAASSVRVKTMADGTLQVTVAVEPRDATEAFRLLGMPGTPVALAALKVGTQLPEPKEKPAEKPKGGPLSQWAAMRGNEPAFQEWLEAHSPELVEALIKRVCRIESRAELDNDERAAAVFRERFLEPWRAYCAQYGIAG